MSTDKAILTPQLADLIVSLKRDISRSLNCIKIGEILDFDKSKKTASVKLKFKRALADGTSMSHPKLINCPVFTLQGGGAAIQLPIQSGDDCLVLFSDRNIDAWYRNGSESVPFDARCHDLSDGIVLVGLNSLASDLKDYEDSIGGLFYSDAQIAINAAGLISIKNQVTDLATLINGLIDVISAITTTGSPAAHVVSAASIALLTAYKVQVATLLTAL